MHDRAFYACTERHRAKRTGSAIAEQPDLYYSRSTIDLDKFYVALIDIEVRPHPRQSLQNAAGKLGIIELIRLLRHDLMLATIGGHQRLIVDAVLTYVVRIQSSSL